jgi:hypothetical protein
VGGGCNIDGFGRVVGLESFGGGMAVCHNLYFAWVGGRVVVVVYECTSFAFGLQVGARVRMDFHCLFAFHNACHYFLVAGVGHGVAELDVWMGELGEFGVA